MTIRLVSGWLFYKPKELRVAILPTFPYPNVGAFSKPLREFVGRFFLAIVLWVLWCPVQVYDFQPKVEIFVYFVIKPIVNYNQLRYFELADNILPHELG